MYDLFWHSQLLHLLAVSSGTLLRKNLAYHLNKKYNQFSLKWVDTMGCMGGMLLEVAFLRFKKTPNMWQKF